MCEDKKETRQSEMCMGLTYIQDEVLDTVFYDCQCVKLYVVSFMYPFTSMAFEI